MRHKSSLKNMGGCFGFLYFAYTFIRGFLVLQYSWGLNVVCVHSPATGCCVTTVHPFPCDLVTASLTLGIRKFSLGQTEVAVLTLLCYKWHWSEMRLCWFAQMHPFIFVQVKDLHRHVLACPHLLLSSSTPPPPFYSTFVKLDLIY